MVDNEVTYKINIYNSLHNKNILFSDGIFRFCTRLTLDVLCMRFFENVIDWCCHVVTIVLIVTKLKHIKLFQAGQTSITKGPFHNCSIKKKIGLMCQHTILVF